MRSDHAGDAQVRDVPFPDHVYVPGASARHPEGWFDALKVDTPTALKAGLVYFEAGYFWECHEVLEAVWMEAEDPSAERDMVQAIIQLANARLKLLMKRPRAADRLCDLVEGLLETVPVEAAPFGLDPEIWRVALEDTRAQIPDY